MFRLLVQSVRDYAVFLLDPTGCIMTWNAGAERIKQYKEEEIIGKHFSVFYPEADMKWNKPAWELERAAADGRFEDEGWRIRKDGSRFWANVIITRVNDEEGNLIGFGKLTRDVTERRNAELRYRLLIEGVTDYAIYSLDPEGKITSWNSGAQRIKGYSAEEIIGQHFSKFYTPEDAAAGMPAKVLQTAREKGHFEGEGFRVRKDGTRFWSSVAVTPLYDEEGHLLGFSKITRDISDRQQLLNQIRQHAQELELQVEEKEATNAELEAFSYSVSHDLRAPLRAIEGFTQALEEEYGDKLDDTGRDYLRMVIEASVRMSGLIQDLLNYSRLSRMDLAPEEVEVNRVVNTAVSQLHDKNAKVKIDVPEGLAVLAHGPTLTQVIYNLIANGLKFSAPERTAEVSVSAEPVVREAGKNVRISVRDNGIGIAPEHQERIFKVFERLHDQSKYPGTGIGLAIVKRGVERMGGTFGLESTVGEGSTFWLELPSLR